jgi:GDP-L-fucose synthase
MPIERVLLLGPRGVAGSAIDRRLTERGYVVTRVGRRELDLRDQKRVEALFAEDRWDAVILNAGLTGGIKANLEAPAEFLYDNSILALNVLRAAGRSDAIRRLIYVASAAVYPVITKRDLRESDLLQGPPESAHLGYSLAKILGLTFCRTLHGAGGRDFLTLVPTNLYGPGADFHPVYSHVVPGLLRRFHEGKRDAAGTMSLWGSGRAVRDLLFADDFAVAVTTLLETETAFESTVFNAGSGYGVTIRELAAVTAKVVGYEGLIEFDPRQPEGAARRVLDISRLTQLGWQPRTSLEKGLRCSYEWALSSGVLG